MGDYVQYMYVHTKESEQCDTMCLEAEILMQKLEIGGWGGRGEYVGHFGLEILDINFEKRRYLLSAAFFSSES